MMTIRFWGVRGSIAASGNDTARVGGNTSCVEVRCGEQILILDAGTGIRGLGAELARRGPGRVSLLLSHYHWDHIQGLPFFAPAYQQGGQLDLFAPGEDEGQIRNRLAAQMTAPHFPVELSVFRTRLRFRPVGAGDRLAIGGASVTTARARHPNGCLAWRIDYAGRSLVYATDTEHDKRDIDKRLAVLADGADLLIYDSQYTEREYEASRKGFGHSTAFEGTRLARAGGVKRLALFHHDPSRDDWHVARIEANARLQFAGTFAAREDLVIELPPRHSAAA